MKTIAKMTLATILAMALFLALMAVGASDNVCIAAYVTTAMVLSFIFGVFDIPEENSNNANAAHDYRDAA